MSALLVPELPPHTMDWLITIAFCIWITQRYWRGVKALKHGNNTKLVAIMPTSLAAIGILGTFTGIVIGLYDFDIGNIDESVAGLLSGLKVAFTTSMYGLLWSIIFRFQRTKSTDTATAGTIGADEIHAVLIEIRDNEASTREQAQMLATKQSDQLDALRNAISSEGDSSLLTQVQKLRTTLQDTNAEMIKEFRSFADHMREHHQKAFIEALSEVIRDFNVNLTEQFGENFKELNAAVHALVGWQENYRTHIETLEAHLTRATDATEAAEGALAAIREHSERIPPAVQALEPVLAGIRTETSALEAHLGAISALRDKAVETFPVIEENLTKVTEGLSAGAERVNEMTTKAFETNERSHAELREKHETFLTEAREAHRISSESQDRMRSELEQTLRHFAEQLSSERERNARMIEEMVQESWQSCSESINKLLEEAFAKFHTESEEELTRVLKMLGENLARVSEKFVQDYGPITDNFNRMIRQLNGGGNS